MTRAKALTDWITERGTSLAALVAATGLDDRVVEAIARGRYTPSPDQRRRLAVALGVEPDQIAWGHVTPVEHVHASTPPTSIVQGDADTLTPLSGSKRYCARLVELGGTCELNVYEGVGHLLTRNLEYQEGDFDPDPQAVAEGIAQHLRFLRKLGFVAVE